MKIRLTAKWTTVCDGHMESVELVEIYPGSAPGDIKVALDRAQEWYSDKMSKSGRPHVRIETLHEDGDEL